MDLIELAKKLRQLIEKAAASLADKDALEAVQLFANWSPVGTYVTGDRVRMDGVLYRCLQDHTAQETWAPGKAHSLWAEVLIPGENVIPEWKQPDSTNPYNKGDKVMHNGRVWVSAVDNNVWAPGAYGWDPEE